MADPDIHWDGISGTTYGYWIHKIGTTFKDEPGNYIYAKETRSGYWSPIYIGQTNSLANRLVDHEKEECTKRNGATHIHAHTSSGGEIARRNEETDLIKKWSPVCNG